MGFHYILNPPRKIPYFLIRILVEVSLVSWYAGVLQSVRFTIVHLSSVHIIATDMCTRFYTPLVLQIPVYTVGTNFV